MTWKNILITTFFFIVGNYIFQLLPIPGSHSWMTAFERSFFQGILGLYLSCRIYFGT